VSVAAQQTIALGVLGRLGIVLTAVELLKIVHLAMPRFSVVLLVRELRKNNHSLILGLFPKSAFQRK
jgi:hypothetical protein